MTMQARLLALLACPVDHGPLLWIEGANVLYNPRLRRAYPVVDGVPDLLVEDAELVDEARHRQLMAAASPREEG